MRFVLVLLVLAVALTAVALARAKDDARARLTSTLPRAAAPGTTVRVGWTAAVPDGNGRRPFGVSGMFVRLLSRTGAPATTGFASGSMHADGRYAAEVRVPAGRIGGIRMGLRGWNDQGAGDLLFLLENDPFTSPGGVRCDVAAVRSTLAAFVRAYNRGDLRTLDRLFSYKHFKWYSWGRNARSDRAALIPNFRRRYQRGDRLRSVTYRFNGYEPERNYGHFELHAERRAEDLQDGRWFPTVGKGVLACATPPVTLALMFLGSR